MTGIRRILIVVLDGLGIGAVDGCNRPELAGANSLRNTLGTDTSTADFPFLRDLGLFAVAGIEPRRPAPGVAWGRSRQHSECPESYSAHWEMAGIVPTAALGHPYGLDPGMVSAVERAIGSPVIGNLGLYPHIQRVPGPLVEEHRRTGRPILLVQAEREPISVIGLYVMPDVVNVDRFFDTVRLAAPQLAGSPVPGRIGARLFDTVDGAVVPIDNRLDRPYFRLPTPTVVDDVRSSGRQTAATGKIGGLFNSRGFARSWDEWGSRTIFRNTLEAWAQTTDGLVWANFNDLSRPCGAHRDVSGWRSALRLYNGFLRELHGRLTDDDLMIVTGDHGVDPTLTGEHTYEWTPLLLSGQAVESTELGDRDHADIAATIADVWGLDRRGTGRTFISGAVEANR